MLRTFIRLTTVLVVASLPIPMQAQSPDIAREVTSTFRDAMREAMREARWAARSWSESSEARQGPLQTEKIAKSFKVGAAGTLDIANVSGDITITEGGGDTITVDAVKRFHGSEADAKDQFTRATVSMAERAGRVEIRTTYTGRNVRVSVGYTVVAPAGTTVISRSVSGDIRVTGIRGDVHAESVSGDIVATNTPAASLLKTVSGDVTATGLASQDELRAGSISGNVVVRGAKLRSINADSISGDINLADVTAEQVTCGSISGEIDFAGPLSKSGRYEMKSQSGNVRLTLAGTTGFELDAQTFSGNVRSDLPVTLKAGEPAGGHRKGIRGVNGDGSAQLLLKSFSGDITIAKK
jgi:hypothetical protein